MKSSILHSNNGYFGKYGGMFLPELLIAPMTELAKSLKIAESKSFQKIFRNLLKEYAGRPTPLTEVKRFAQAANAPRVFLKREDLLHTGSHKINNALGQCLLAKELGKKRIIAETGAGQHGVATATICAYLGLDCVVYMGACDIKRQEPNVRKMKMLGAEVRSVNAGSMTLKEAVNEALRDYAESYENTHYCLGSALGPHPYPQMVALFQKVIGEETRKQSIKYLGRLPDKVVACVGGGSNAIGIFSGFLEDDVNLIGVEAGGRGAMLGDHAARFSGGSPGVLHGTYSYILQDDSGQIADTHSISAGMDYPSVSPIHALLHDTKKATYTSVNDQEALAAFKLLSKTEGIIPALESSHALAWVMREGKHFQKNEIIIICLSGRGEKDLNRDDL
ncbi:MAG TPA: tryptophan synthase subunit beta [Lentisphaeria bacterium]|nr:MAG: tryptophan synthase subunit beta [Lentisphaerae bacterium GWF2_38_69]HBM15580.1 tryptophan synthase subunit beta [Lentisphaeria bacterium]